MKNKTGKWTPQELKRLVESTDIRALATELGRSYNAVINQRVRVKARGVGISQADVPAAGADVPGDAKAKAPTEYSADKVAATEKHWKAQHDALAAKYKAALKDAALTEKLVEEIKSMAPQSYETAPSVSRPRKESHSSPQSAVLLFSDTHIGKVTLREQTLGFSEYNFHTFLARLKYVEDSVVSILRDHITTEVPELVIPMLGDMLDGALSHGVEAGQRNTLFSQFYAGGHAIAQFFRNLAAHVPKVRIQTVCGNHCVDEETEILTGRGWLSVHQLTAGDTCLGLSGDGSRSFWQPIDAVVKEAAVDKLVSVRNKQFDFRGTEHHRFYYWVNRYPQLNESRWSELPSNDCRFSISIPTAAKMGRVGRPDLRPFLALCGAVLSDGYISKDRSKVIVYQSKNDAWVRAAFDASGLTYYERSRVREYPKQIGGVALKATGTTTEKSFALSAKHSREFLGITGLVKGQLPAWAWDLNEDEFLVFWRALLEGDGAELDTNSPCLSAKSYKFASDLQGLLATHGITSSVSRYQPKASHGPQYRLNINYTDRVPVGSSAQIAYEDPTGKVWCVRTTSENFFCRRNGKSYFTGNTRWQNQRRMPTENRFSNLDMFLYALVQALTSDIPNIEWNLNQQPFQVFGVQGFTFFGAHGDHWRGGDKALGIPNHAIGRQLSTTSQLFNKHDAELPNYYVSGHLHRSITLPHAIGEVMVNGGFPGLDNFGLAENFNPVDPIQRFFFVHPRYGRTASYDLTLKHAEAFEGNPPYQIPNEFPVE